MTPTTAGTAALTLQAWVRKQHGEHGWQVLLNRVAPEHALELRGIVLAQKQYPTATIVAAIEEAAALDGGADFFERYGEWAASFHMNAFFKFLLKFKSPGWVVGRGARVWRTFHSTGEWEIEIDESGRRLRLALSDFAVVSPNYCRVVAGWMRGAGKLTGAPDVRILHPACRARGAAACVFTGEW